MGIPELEQQIKNANAAYATGMPYLTDQEYDELWQQLHALDPYNKNLYHTARDPKLGQDIHPHLYKIKGTQKAFKQDDLRPFLQRFGSKTFILEPKYDGCAAVLYRQEGGEFKLLLEGNGLAGRDISHHLKNITMKFAPQIVPSAIESGEIIIPIKNWKKEYGANPRNTIAGWLARKELPYSDIVEFVPHNKAIRQHGYTYEGNLEKFSELLLGLHTRYKEDYPIDGVMIKVADPKLRLTSDTHPDVYAWSIAWKPPIQTKETTVTDIEWNVSRTGRVIPTVIYEPIELCGTTNTRATGNNAQWIIDGRLEIGIPIVVGKAGEIIPKIVEIKPNDYSNINPPSSCPICKEKLIWKGKDLICNGESCLPQLTKSLHYFYSDKGMDLKSIGENMIADLLDNPDIYKVLVDKPYALLNPKKFNIYDGIVKCWGQKRARTYMFNINEINETKNICHLIAAMGKEGLAYKTSLKLMHYVKGYKLKSHVPTKSIENFIEIFVKFADIQDELGSFKLIPTPDPPKVMYCITGTLSSPRPDMITYLEKYQWQFSNQMSKFVNVLIVGDKPGRIKTTKAKELNIKTISEDELPKYLDKETKDG